MKPLPQIAALALSFLALASPRASSQSGHFGPRGPEFRVNGGANYNQYWGRVAIADDASRIQFSFNGGQDVYARMFGGEGQPLTGDLSVNSTLYVYIQDENEVALATNGNALVAWSDRNGYDGEIMGIFGRLLSPAGVPFGTEFQINVEWQASQWRPLIASRPAGGWAVAWTGRWDGDAFFRILDGNGVPLTGDIQVNTFMSGAQVDTALAIAPDGTMLLVFVDFTQWGGAGTGTNLWARLYDQHGNALQTAEWRVNTPSFAAGDQREPRVCADGLGRFLVVWESEFGDGSGYGIFARRFDTAGQPLGGEFQVNSTTAGHQRSARAAADAAGNFVVVWEDRSGADADIRARRFDPQAAPLGLDFVVHAATAGDQRRPSLDLTPAGEDLVFVYEAPGVVVDAFARIYTTYQPPARYCTAKQNSQGCLPRIGSNGKPAGTGPDDFHVTADQVLNNKRGLLFLGLAPASVPFSGGTLCVGPPVVMRTALQDSGGNPPPDDCSGTYSFHLTQAFLSARGLAPGTLVHGQYWSRDPGFPPPNATGLTDGLVFEIRP